MDRAQPGDWWSLERLVEHLPRHELSEAECLQLGQGQQISGELWSDECVAWSGGVVQGIVERGTDGGIKARRWLSRGVREVVKAEDLS